MGGKSLEEVKAAFECLEEILTEEGHFCLIGDFKIRNVVASFYLGHKIDLGKLKESSSNAKYEPELFPGLRYKLSHPIASVVAFSSGKYNITGLKTIAGADIASIVFQEVIQELINSSSLSL